MEREGHLARMEVTMNVCRIMWKNQKEIDH
jgi:hypothetical protein